MLRINEYLEPGPYEDEKGKVVVVLDVLNYVWNDSAGLPEAIPVPLVVVRDLEESKTEHARCGYPIDVFRVKFKKI